MKKITFLLNLFCFSLVLQSKTVSLQMPAASQSAGITAKKAPTSLAFGDTLFHIPLLTYTVNPSDIAAFQIVKEDGDGFIANSNALQNPSWGIYFSKALSDIDPSQGDVDTAFYYGANSWFTPPGIADNWLILGPISLPAAGGSLSWRIKEADPDFMDGYRVLANITGGTSSDFTLPALYTVGDNDPSNDTVWISHSVQLDAATYGGQQVYIAFHHNADDMNALYLDNILLTENASTILTNDECTGATDINSAFGGNVNSVQTVGPFDNTNATTSALDPINGFDCFGEPDGSGTGPELNKTLWFTFTGDGATYFIESGNCGGVTNYITDGDTQFGLYTGNCGSLSPFACNDDGPNLPANEFPAGFTIATTPGTPYYLMVDGFNFQGSVSTGEFCLLVKKLQSIPCNDPSITAGNVSQNTSSLCFGDTVKLSSANAIAPAVGAVSGFSWVITSADISGSHNPLDTATFIASYGFLPTAPAVSNLNFVNDTVFLPPGSYFWTPVVFGNAVDTAGSSQFLSQLVLDTSCIHSGTSLLVILLAAGDTSCTPPVLTPVNDECAGAININSAFGGSVNVVQAVGPYDNTLATTSAFDPINGFECFGEPDGTGTGPELNNTLWFTFTGDGGSYLIESGNCGGVINYITDGDTQFGMYTGSCGNLIPFSCNEDGPSATTSVYPAGDTITTSPGTIYYLMVDGFSFQGAVSIGEFCLLVKKLPGLTCNDPSITVGSESQTSSSICVGDSVSLSTTGAVVPTIGAVNGISWVLTNADISGTNNPLNPATFVDAFSFATIAPSQSTISYINDATLSAGTYFFTPVVFGNAVDASGTAQYLDELLLDTSCIHTGTSLQVILLAAGDTSCVPPINTPINDECIGAINIDASFGAALNVVQTSGPYDNTLATTSALDPTAGFACFGEPDGSGSAPELNNNLWFTFTGDGATYLVESGTCNGVVNYISDGDTQFGLYTGSCGSLTPLACNEDGPSATASAFPAGLTIATTLGTVYYLMVDGFNFQGALAQGEYCVLVKKLSGVGILENTAYKSDALLVYPSPATDKLNLQFNSLTKGNTTISITDITGRELLRNSIPTIQGLTSLSLDVKNIAIGAYWIRVADEHGSRIAKFLKK